MERYIKVDELETIVKVTDWSNPAVPIVLYMIIDRCSTADVAPRSEVAREIFGEMGATAFTMHDDDSGEFILCMYCEDFEEIKQKYTEEQK